MRNIIILSLAMMILAGVCFSADSLGMQCIGRLEGITCHIVIVDGDYAYIATDDGMTIVNIAEPDSPRVVSPYSMDRMSDFCVSFPYIYAVFGNNTYGIVNVSNPAYPITVVDGGSYYARHLDYISKFGHWLYVVGDNQLSTYYLEDPEWISASYVELYMYDDASDVVIQGSYAYVAASSYGIHVVDISDPTVPDGVGWLDTDGLAKSVYVSGDYAYVADGSDGLVVIDISSVTPPTLAGNIDTDFDAVDVVVSGDYAYVADYDGGIRKIDISTPTEPVEVGYYDTDGFAECVFMDEPYIYVADNWNGLYILANTVGIEESANVKPHTLSLTAFPNPFNSSCAITAPKGAEIEIYDLRGTLRLRSVPDDSEARSLSEVETTDNLTFIWMPDETIASGIYIVKARTEDGRTASKRVVYLR